MVLSTDQSSHTTLHECKLLLGTDKVRVQNQLVGGGFGGKEDMSVQHHAALMTYLTGRTVKVKLTRPEIAAHPPEASPVLDGLHHGLRRKRHHPGRQGQGLLRYRRVRLPRRPGARARLYARGRPLQLSEFRDRGHGLLYRQPARGRVPRLRRHADVLRYGDASERNGRQGRHHPLGDPLPQRHPARAGAAERPDRRLGDGPGRDARGGEAVFRRGDEAGQARRPGLRDEERGRRRRHSRLGPLQADRGGRREGPYLRGRILHRPGTSAPSSCR